MFNRLYRNGWTPWQSFGLLALRLIAGTAFVLHGWPKFQHPMSWMSAMGPDAAHPVLQAAAALAEFGGGIALIFGFLTPLAAAGISANMLYALFMVLVPKGAVFVDQSGGGNSFELPLVYLGVMVALFATGPGRFSLDALVWRDREFSVEEREAWRHAPAA